MATQVMDAGLITFQAGSSFDATKAWHFMCLGRARWRVVPAGQMLVAGHPQNWLGIRAEIRAKDVLQWEKEWNLRRSCEC